MKKYLSDQQLSHKISVLARKSVEYRQVAKRLQRLLPVRLREISFEYRKSNSAGKSQRLALLDKRYLFYINELHTISASAAQARVEWELSKMIFISRKQRY